MRSARNHRPRRYGLAAVLIVLASASWTEAARSGGDKNEVRAVTERFLVDWNRGRLRDSHEAFSARLQQLVTVTQLESSLVAVRNELGQYVALEAVHFTDEQIDGQGAIVLEATLRFERGTTGGKFAALAERGAWRLRYVKIDLPLDQRPPLDDAPVATIANEILAVLQREGLASIVRILPKPALEQFGEQAVRELFERMAQTMGVMRSHWLGRPSALGEGCRQLAGRGKFEHGEATLRIALCPEQGVWRLLAIDVTPEMTPLLFERMARAILAQTLKRTDFELSCPATLVAVGGDATCRFTSRGETRRARVRRVEDADLDVALLPE